MSRYIYICILICVYLCKLVFNHFLYTYYAMFTHFICLMNLMAIMLCADCNESVSYTIVLTTYYQSVYTLYMFTHIVHTAHCPCKYRETVLLASNNNKIGL